MTTKAISDWPLLDEYDIRFDTPIEPVIFGRYLDIHGSLIHRAGKPIHGIRVVISKRLSRPKVIRARRKRNRPEVAVTYPHLPDALASGFLLELRLGLGRNHLLFQVEDHERVWRTFRSTSVFVLPAPVLTASRFVNLRRTILLCFKHGADRTGLNDSASFNAYDSLRNHGGEHSDERSHQTRIRLFVTSKSNLFIVEIAELLAAGFREICCDTELFVDQIPNQTPPSDILQIVVTPHEFYNLFLRERLSRPRLRQLTRSVVLVCAEQPETHWFHNNLPWTFNARGVADISPLGAAAYRLRGVACHHLQLGYHSMLAHSSIPPHQDRGIDIAFLGSLTPKREAFFLKHAEFFSEHICQLRLVLLEFAKTAATRSYLHAGERNKVLSQSRILLNLHYSDQTYFEWHRMLVGLANGCCIITETCQGYGALQPGKHFVMVEPEDLIPCCEYYLAHPDECAQIARQGMEFIQAHLRQGDACRTFLDALAKTGADPSLAPRNDSKSPSITLPVDSVPIPLPSELRQKLKKLDTQRILQALRSDLRRTARKAEAKLPDPVDSKRPAILNSGCRDEVIRRRQGYHDRWVKQEEMRRLGESFIEFNSNAAFSACTKPGISILITLYNYADFIEECVASVEKSAARLAIPCEVIIVNDASTDHSLTRALYCLRRSQLAIRVVDKKLNTGLADARNIALELARAPYVFILDADNLIYPNALRQLYAAITSDDYAAAYSLLCRFQGTIDNRIGLLSHFDWDPEVLVQFPYIDAMAMFRRDALREPPGYDHQLSQIGWFGWEDYDMWLRFAQKQRRVAFVPNILCLYRHHLTSMINTTILFQRELVRHFITNYGELIDRFEPREHLFGIERAALFEERETEVVDSK